MSKLKQLFILSVALILMAGTAYAAVKSIVNTPYSSSYGSRGVSGGTTGSSGDGGSHTSEYEGQNRPACGAVTVDASSGEEIGKNLCATALGVDTAKVSFELCGDGKSGNCNYLETCTGVGTGETISGNGSVAISQAIKTILAKYTNVDNNLGTENARCSAGGIPRIYFKCDSSYNLNSEPTCTDGKTALSCSLNGSPVLWKCDYAACTSEELNKTVGDDVADASSLLRGTKVTGSCYENMSSGNRKLRKIYGCNSDIYKYTETSCVTEKGDSSAVATTLGACVWNGAYRQGQATLIDEAQAMYESCLSKCPAALTESAASCEKSGDVLNQCVKTADSAVDNQILQFCGCPLKEDGSEDFIAADECSGNNLAGGRSCTSAVTGTERYEYCLPKCSASQTIKGSYLGCVQALEAENTALSYTPIPAATEATPLALNGETTDFNRYPSRNKCCRKQDGVDYDCIEEPFKINSNGTCEADNTFFCANGFTLKNGCKDDTQFCCQFKSGGAVIAGTCLGAGTFIANTDDGTCQAGASLENNFDFCADTDKKKDASCSVEKTTQCCTFVGNDSTSRDNECSSDFILLSDSGACSKVVDKVVDSKLCFMNEGDETASYECKCPENSNYITGNCPAGQKLMSSCSFDGVTKNVCAGTCSQEDINAGRVKSNINECKLSIYDEVNATLCTKADGSLNYRCSCPTNYIGCPTDTGAGEVCTFDGGEKYRACRLNRSAINCDESRNLYDAAADCATANGTPTISTQCIQTETDGSITYKYMCECPAAYSVCSSGQSGGGDYCRVYSDSTTYYEKCGPTCRINTTGRPVVDAADGCPKIGEDAAPSTMCVTGGDIKYECKCPAGYNVAPTETSVGVGNVCTYDGTPKYKSFEEGCPVDRPVFYTEDACSFDGVKGINVRTCHVNGVATEENMRYYCDCPNGYLTNSQCQAGGASKEGTGLMCQLEGQTAEKTKYQFCYNKCNNLPSASTNNGTIMTDDIADTRACAWELGQGAVYEQCSDNHSIKNKCYCGAAYDGRLTCLATDNLSPIVDASKPACTIDGVTYYQQCQARQCDERKTLATSEGGCNTLLGNASTAIKCSKDGETVPYYECSCDTSVYKESCKYPQIEPTGAKYCYDKKYDASSYPNPVKQYVAGSCKVGAIEKCYQAGDSVPGYAVTVTKSESACRQQFGDGAQARLCEDRNDPDIRGFNCYYTVNDYKWTEANCPVRHVLGGGSVVINGIRYYKECNCHPAYKAHRYNCAGLLSGGGCEQDVTATNNDGTIPSGITKLKYYPYCSCPEDYTQVCDGERNVGVGEPCNGKYKACECKKDELPENWADNYYGCPGGAKPTGITKPNGCGGKFYQCEVSQCNWEYTEQCKGDFQIGVDPCQDNQGNIYAYKSCKCPDGWSKCSSSQVGDGKPCSLKGENYYKSCAAQSECQKGEYLTCNAPLQVGVNPCTKNDKTYFESCTCASGYNKKCEDGETGVGSACVIDGVSYYTACNKPTTVCTDKHKEACADNQEKYEPCVTSDNKMRYKCRCPANYTACTGTTPATGATTCEDSDKGTLYNACTSANTCTTDEETIYKTCTKQQVGLGRSCVSSDGSTKYAECQDTNDCKANGYKYTCSGYQADALGDDSCVDDKGTKLYKECKCPTNWLQCPSKNVKGTPCTPLKADGTSGDTVYSKCECGTQYSETCTDNGQSPGAEEDACDSLDSDGTKVTRYKSCNCAEEYNKNCAESGAIPTEKSEICTEVKYVGTQKVKTEKYRSCGCGENFKYKCDGTDSGDDAANASKYTLSGACSTTVDGEGVTKYRSCACGSSYTITCTANIQEGADSCTSINADGTRVTKYVAGSCPEPPCEPSDCSAYTIANTSAIIGQCGHPKNYDYCSPGCGQATKYACLYPKSDIEDKWKYTRDNCPEPNELSDGKTFNFAAGYTETRYQKCNCPSTYNMTAAICSSINASSANGASGNIVCSQRSKPVAPVTTEYDGVCLDYDYKPVNETLRTQHCCQSAAVPSASNLCDGWLGGGGIAGYPCSNGSCKFSRTTSTSETFTPASCGPILGLDTSDICVDGTTKETRGKYCKCDGPDYSSSSCPSSTALVCKKSSSSVWEVIKCQ